MHPLIKFLDIDTPDISIDGDLTSKINYNSIIESDFSEKENKYEWIIPGCEKDKIKMNVNKLSNKIYLKAEDIRGNNYKGTIRILSNFDIDNIKATYKAGILYITIPKVKRDKGFEVKIG